jgi:hypothetical protein
MWALRPFLGATFLGGTPMAVVVVAEFPTGTRAQDETIQEKVTVAGNPPPGSLVRTAGPYKNGYRVISVWESQEAFDTFRRERLEPAIRQMGIAVPIFEISALDMARIIPQKS